MPGREPFMLPPRDPVLYFVQRLRDEAHRFAIGSHRARRKKDIREAGLRRSPASARRASARCCSISARSRRSSARRVADLSTVPGINAETARKIYDFFHETGRAGDAVRRPLMAVSCASHPHAAVDAARRANALFGA